MSVASANEKIGVVLQHMTVFCRYGRMPKPTKPLTYPAKEDTHSSASETTPASPPGSAAPGTRVKTKCTTKKKQSSKSKSVQQSKKPKLVTLRASQSEYSDDEDGVGEEQHPACSSSISAFVPASLCSLHPVSVEVEETMEEVRETVFILLCTNTCHPLM